MLLQDGAIVTAYNPKVEKEEDLTRFKNLTCRMR